MISLSYLLAYSIAIPAIVGSIRYMNLPLYGRIFSWQMGIGLLVEFVAQSVAHTGNNLWVYYWYIFALYWLVAFFFESISISAKSLRWLSLVLIVEAFHGLDKFPSISLLILCMYVIYAGLAKAFGMINGSDTRPWLILALISFYYASSLVYLCLNRFLSDPEITLLSKIWSWTNLGCNVGFAFALWRLGRH